MIENKKIVFTTSWDDGHILDKRAADLLNRYGLKGTFYVSQIFNGEERLSESDIKNLSEKQEIGAHTLTHPKLTEVSLEKAREEIAGSKEYLERLLGREIKMFCYPYGDYDPEIKEIVKESGFLGARTTDQWRFGIGSDFFEMPTSLHVYPFPFRPLSSKRQYKNPKNFLGPLLNAYSHIFKYRLGVKSFFSWQELARASFMYAKAIGEIFHLFGHSWEIEKYGMWRELEEFLRFASKQDGIIYLTNSEVLEFFSKKV